MDLDKIKQDKTQNTQLEVICPCLYSPVCMEGVTKWEYWLSFWIFEEVHYMKPNALKQFVLVCFCFFFKFQ